MQEEDTFTNNLGGCGGCAVSHPPTPINNEIDLEQVDSILLYGVSIKSTNSEKIVVKIPGWGEGERYCGSGYKVKACPEHKEEAKAIVQHCERRSCPKCKDYWIGELVDKAEHKLLEARRLYFEDDFELGKLRHIVISLPESWKVDTVDDYRKYRREVNRLLKEAGLLGGCAVYHHLRTTIEAKIEFAKAKKNGDISAKQGIWDWVIAHGHYEDLKYVRVSPHVHVLGYGFLEPADVFFEETGCVYKNIIHKNNDGSNKEINIRNVLKYELSHCGIIYTNLEEKSKFQVLTWIGMLSNGKMCKDKEKSYFKTEVERCDVKGCDLALHVYRGAYGVDILIEDGEIKKIDWDEMYDEGEYERKVEIVVFKIIRGSVYYRWDNKKRCKVKERFLPKVQSSLDCFGLS